MAGDDTGVIAAAPARLQDEGPRPRRADDRATEGRVGREGAGIVSLAQWAGNAPKSKTTVLYCGCCPWIQCPNVAPAYVALKEKIKRLKRNAG